MTTKIQVLSKNSLSVRSSLNTWLRVSFATLIFCFIPILAFGQVYVSPTGSDTSSGTIDHPYKTLAHALNSAGPDSTIYLRGGYYASSSKITISKNGTAGHYITISAYNGEIPILYFASETVAGNSDGVKLSGTYIHLFGIRFDSAAHNGLNVSGHHNIIENCAFYKNRNSGFQMGSSSDSLSNPSYNLILNCDSYLNFDSAGKGGNADGFGTKWYIGSGNVFKGCRAYNNSDDGWDLWMADSSVEIDSCIAFRNGIDIWHTPQESGNGNGFKLGGNYIPTHHVIRNCVSFDNGGNTGRGYDENNNTAGQTVYNCTAYRNKGDNFHFQNTVVSGQHIIENCISYVGTITITSGTRQNDTWTIPLTVSNLDFKSIDTSLAVLPRNADGTFKDSTFFRLASGSQLIDAGMNVGLPYNGSAPDLGAFEYYPTITTFTLTTNAVHGTVTKNPVLLRYDSASTVQVTAVPDTGYHFSSWTGDTTSTANPLTIVMNGNKNVTANFSPNQYSVNVTADHGTVTKTPNQSTYDYNSKVVLSVTPDHGWIFKSWIGDFISTNNPDTVLVNKNKNISVQFALDTITMCIQVSDKWNLISVPLTPVDSMKSSLFPTALSSAFIFKGGYDPIDTLEPGYGFWLKLPSSDSLCFRGFELLADTIHVVAGWNLIGSISVPVSVSSITSIPNGIVAGAFYFSYSNGYVSVSTIEPGGGYWVKASVDGVLILSQSPASRTNHANKNSR